MMIMMMMWTILELLEPEIGEKCKQITQKCIFQVISNSWTPIQ